MELEFLGTASAVPSKQRNHTSISLKAFGEVMLFDCGEGTQRQLTDAHISPMKINKIFITHFHGDHILGLPGLIQSMGFRGRENPLDVYGPKGLKALLAAIQHLGYFVINFPLNFHEISEEGTIVDNEDYIINCTFVEHNVPALAYSITEKKKPRFLREKAIELGVPVGPDFGRLHNGETITLKGETITPEMVLGPPRTGRKITYSGDTRPNENLIKLAENSDILIHEATYEEADEEKAINNSH
jgi:ribonuclease Z